MENNYKPLPIGYQSFLDVIMDGRYYIDKTQFLEKLLSTETEQQKFVWITRPSRFGKSMLLSMVHHFLDSQLHSSLLSQLGLRGLPDPFLNTKISQNDTLCSEYKGNCTVISLDFLSLISSSLNKFQKRLKQLIRAPYLKFNNATRLLPNYSRVLELEFDKEEIPQLFRDLCHSITEYNKKENACFVAKPFILIDEFDAPLSCAMRYSFFSEAESVIEDFLLAVFLETEIHEKIIVTGVTRFPGLKRLISSDISICSSLNGDYFSDCIGFTEREVKELLSDVTGIDCDTVYENLKKRYGNYYCGKSKQVLFNTWSVSNAIKDIKVSKSPYNNHYWLKTQHESTIISIIHTVSRLTRDKIIPLLRKDTTLTVSINDTTIMTHPVDELVVISSGSLPNPPKKAFVLLFDDELEEWYLLERMDGYRKREPISENNFPSLYQILKTPHPIFFLNSNFDFKAKVIEILVSEEPWREYTKHLDEARWFMSVLYHTGFLTGIYEENQMRLMIPNEEIHSFWLSQLKHSLEDYPNIGQK